MIAIHPSELVKEIDPDLTVASFSRKAKISSASASRFLSGKSDMSASMALKLEDIYVNSAEYWMQMQANYSIAKKRSISLEVDSGE